MSSILIKNGHLVFDNKDFKKDLLIENDKIVAIEENIDISDNKTQVIDASGSYVLPGGIDPHVHMELLTGSGFVSSDNFTSGSIAAINGGTTTIIDFVTPNPGQSLAKALADRKQVAAESFCNYGLHMSITSFSDKLYEEVKNCIENEGISSFKIYMAYKDSIGLDDRDILRVLEIAEKLNVLILVHCENGDLITHLKNTLKNNNKTDVKYHPISRPPEAEVDSINRMIVYSKITNAKIYIVHVSTCEGIKRIIKARENNQIIFSETCPHYLFFDDSKYNEAFNQAVKYVMSPPLRKLSDVEGLWNLLSQEDINIVATDHCPFNLKGQKDEGVKDFTMIPNGVPGVENRLSLLYTYGVLKNKIDIHQFVEIVSAKPAKVFGLYPDKGTLRIGSDADVLIWNPEYEDVISADHHKSNCDNNPYEGFKIKGRAEVVIINGKVVKNGDNIILNDKGRFLYRKRCIFN